MNMFQNGDSFLGCLNNSITEDSLLAIFSLAKRIRLRLDKQGYLLDRYLSLFFEGAASGLACDIADDGFMASGRPQSILFHVLDGTEPNKPDSLYKQTQEFYEQHRDNFQFQERYTNLCLLTFPLADKFTLQITANFLEKQREHLYQEIDIIQLHELYDQITHFAGESLMAELNELLRQRFLIAPLALIYAQGITADLLYKLISRDYETSKKMFQLLMDDLPISDLP